MTLLSLLLALLIERVTAKTDQWRAQYHIDKYVEWVKGKGWLKGSTDTAHLLAIVLVPTLLVFWIADWLGNGIIGLLFNTVILYLCIGCPRLRATYKCFLQAANRGDVMACELHSEALGHNADSGYCGSFGQHLVWLNYTHYAAVIIAFMLLGSAGAVLYVLSYALYRYVHTEWETEEDQPAVVKASVSISHWVDFIPVRITALGFLLVGHFGRAMPIWFEHLFDGSVTAKRLLCEVSTAAEDVEAKPPTLDDPESIISEPKILVKLAKRNITFLVSVVSVLTVFGAL